MTYKEKVYSYLKVLNVKPDHDITRQELKKSFLELTKLYPIDKDTKKYYEIKDAYDYLYDNIDSIKEALNAPEEVKEVVIPNKVLDEKEAVVIPPVSDIKVKDRPTLMAAILSLMSPLIGFMIFFMLRKVTPKSSWLYLGLAILSLVFAIFLVFMLPYLA